MQNGRQNKQSLRRMFSMARRPTALIAIGQSTRGHLATVPFEDLQLTMKAINLAMKHERARSALHHWSCDVNRQIALRAARDRVEAEIDARSGDPAPKRKKPRTNSRLEDFQSGPD